MSPGTGIAVSDAVAIWANMVGAFCAVLAAIGFGEAFQQQELRNVLRKTRDTMERELATKWPKGDFDAIHSWVYRSVAGRLASAIPRDTGIADLRDIRSGLEDVARDDVHHATPDWRLVHTALGLLESAEHVDREALRKVSRLYALGSEYQDGLRKLRMNTPSLTVVSPLTISAVLVAALTPVSIVSLLWRLPAWVTETLLYAGFAGFLYVAFAALSHSLRERRLAGHMAWLIGLLVAAALLAYVHSGLDVAREEPIAVRPASGPPMSAPASTRDSGSPSARSPVTLRPANRSPAPAQRARRP